jgi:hypothetical protein
MPKAAQTSLPAYKRKLLLRAAAATGILAGLLSAFVLIDGCISLQGAYAGSGWLRTGIFSCAAGIAVCWFLYDYYLGRRKKLKEETGENATDD